MKQFWQIQLYELTTRALIHADQKRSRLRSKKNPPKDDYGTLDLNFGPQRSAASPELNWVQTNPGDGPLVRFGLFGPKFEFYDRSWKLPDFEKGK